MNLQAALRNKTENKELLYFFNQKYTESPTYMKITNTVSITTFFFTYVLVSGGISVSRGPQYNPTNTNSM